MPFTGDTFAHLFDWFLDPQRQEKIVNARLEAEFDGIDTGLSAVAARVTAVEPTSGVWTPVITFDTAGDLSVAYTTQVGTYKSFNGLVFATCNLQTSSFTHTTASGALRVTGLPSTATNTAKVACVWRGITKANYTDVQASSVSGQTYCLFNICGSGQAATTVAVGDMPTGGTVVLSFTLIYEA